MYTGKVEPAIDPALATSTTILKTGDTSIYDVYTQHILNLVLIVLEYCSIFYWYLSLGPKLDLKIRHWLISVTFIDHTADFSDLIYFRCRMRYYSCMHLKLLNTDISHHAVHITDHPSLKATRSPRRCPSRASCRATWRRCPASSCTRWPAQRQRWSHADEIIASDSWLHFLSSC